MSADLRLLRIAVDYDNVLVKSAELKSFWASKLFKKEIPPEIFRKRILVPSCLTKEEYCMLRKIIYTDIETAYRLKPVDGSLHFLNALLDEGHFVACVTSQQGFGLQIAKEYLARQRLPIECFGVGYGKSKANRLKKLAIDAFFDDDPHKLMQLTDSVPHLFLHDWAYNRYLEAMLDPDLIERAGSRKTCAWERFYERIHQIEKGQFDP